MMPRLTRVEMLKIKNKEKILKATRGKRAITSHINKEFSRKIESMGYTERERCKRRVTIELDS